MVLRKIPKVSKSELNSRTFYRTFYFKGGGGYRWIRSKPTPPHSKKNTPLKKRDFWLFRWVWVGFTMGGWGLLKWKSSFWKKVRKTHLKSEKHVFLLVFLTFGHQIIHFSDFDVLNMHALNVKCLGLWFSDFRTYDYCKIFWYKFVKKTHSKPPPPPTPP